MKLLFILIISISFSQESVSNLKSKLNGLENRILILNRINSNDSTLTALFTDVINEEITVPEIEELFLSTHQNGSEYW